MSLDVLHQMDGEQLFILKEDWLLFWMREFCWIMNMTSLKILQKDHHLLQVKSFCLNLSVNFFNFRKNNNRKKLWSRILVSVPNVHFKIHDSQVEYNLYDPILLIFQDLIKSFLLFWVHLKGNFIAHKFVMPLKAFSLLPFRNCFEISNISILKH